MSQMRTSIPISRSCSFLNAAVCLFVGLTSATGWAALGTNHPPLVGEIVVSDAPAPRSDVSLSVAATDADGDVLSYTWDAGDGTVVVGGKTFTHQWISGGTYQVSVTVKDGRGGVVTSSKSLMLSEHFTPRVSGTTEVLNAITSNGSLAVAVGPKGTVTTSTDGITWLPRSLYDVLEPTFDLKAVAWDGHAFIAVGCGDTFGVIYTSPDGFLWSRRYKGAAHLYAVASSGTLTLAVGDNGTILRSTDGVTWEDAPAPDATPREQVVFGGVAYGNGTFVLTSRVDSSVPPASNGGSSGGTSAGSITIGSSVSSGATLSIGGGNSLVYGGVLTLYPTGNVNGGTATITVGGSLGKAGLSGGSSTSTLGSGSLSTGATGGTTAGSITLGSTVSSGATLTIGSGVTMNVGNPNSSTTGTLTDSGSNSFGLSGGSSSSTLGSGSLSTGAGTLTLTGGSNLGGGVSGSVLVLTGGAEVSVKSQSGLVATDPGSDRPVRNGVVNFIQNVFYGDTAVTNPNQPGSLSLSTALGGGTINLSGGISIQSKAPAEFAAADTTIQAKLFTSPDAVTWTDRSAEARLDSAQPFHRVAVLNGRIVVSGANVGVDAAGNPSRSKFATSLDNGTTFRFSAPVQEAWTSQFRSAFAFGKGVDMALPCNDLIFFKDTFLLIGSVGDIRQSDVIVGAVPVQITQQPAATKVTAGSDATFLVRATGKGPFTYQWLKDGAALPGATLASYQVGKVTSDNAGIYSVVVRNPGGEVLSAPASLTVKSLPVVVTQPQGEVLRAGARLELSVNVTSTETVTYQWRRNGAKISGATHDTFVVPVARTSDAATYDVVVTNSAGSVTSAGALLRVNASVAQGADVPPVITRQPVGKVVRSGDYWELSVGAMGTDGSMLGYQWFQNGVALLGEAGPVYHGWATWRDQAGRYSVVVSSGNASVSSEEVSVVLVQQSFASGIGTYVNGIGELNSFMRITSQPVGGRFLSKSKVTLSVSTEAGVAPLTYQWMQDGVPVRGAHGARLVLSGVTAAQAGNYTVEITDGAGLTLLSQAANVQIQDTTPLVGAYQGLITDAAFRRQGRATVVLNPTGSFSGRVEYLGNVFPVAGVFDGAMAFEKEILRPDGTGPANVRVSFSETGALTAGVLDSGTWSTGEIPKFGFNLTNNKATQAGRYSVLIGLANRYVTPGTENPAGFLGLGSFVVSAGGMVTASGRLPDATTFSMSAMMRADGMIPWYNGVQESGPRAGWLCGWIPADYTNPAGSGTIRWSKPPQPSGFFANGFFGTLKMSVSPYALPRSGRVLSGSTGTLNFTLTRWDGSFLTKTFTLSSTNALDVTGDNPEQLSLQLNRQTGLVNGSLVDSVSGETLKLEGVTLQTQLGEISGFAFGATQLGVFTLVP